MQDKPNQRRLPDVLLERYLAGDLSEERRTAVERTLQDHPESAERLAVLDQARKEFLLADPPDQFAHRIIAKVELGRVMDSPNRGFSWGRFVKTLGLPSVAMAAVAVIALTISDDLGDSSPLEEAVTAERVAEKSFASKEAAPKPAQSLKVAEKQERSHLNEIVFDEIGRGEARSLTVGGMKGGGGSSTKEAKAKLSATKGAPPMAPPPKRVMMAKKQAAAGRRPAPASSLDALVKGVEIEKLEEEMDEAPMVGSAATSDDSMPEAEAEPSEAFGAVSSSPAASKSFLMSARGRAAPKDLNLSVRKKRKGGPRTAESRNVAAGIEVSFLSPSNYYFLVVKREGNQVRSLSGALAVRGQRGKNQIVLKIPNRPQGLGTGVFVVTSTLPFGLRDIKLLNKLPRLDANWTGTLTVFHTLPSPK